MGAGGVPLLSLVVGFDMRKVVDLLPSVVPPRRFQGRAAGAAVPWAALRTCEDGCAGTVKLTEPSGEAHCRPHCRSRCRAALACTVLWPELESLGALWDVLRRAATGALQQVRCNRCAATGALQQMRCCGKLSGGWGGHQASTLLGGCLLTRGVAMPADERCRHAC